VTEATKMLILSLNQIEVFKIKNQDKKRVRSIDAKLSSSCPRRRRLNSLEKMDQRYSKN
jgi:hypothetical protein